MAGSLRVRPLLAALALLVFEPADGMAQQSKDTNAPKQQGIHGVYVEDNVPDVTIVDGERQAVIVQPYFDKSDLLKEAVALLHKTIKDATGKSLKVVNDGDEVPEGKVKIHVGMTGRVRATLGPRLKQMDADGYILLARPDEVLIGGASDHGLSFGVADLLHRFVGARWFLQGELGYVCPRHEKLVFSGVNCIESPDYWLQRGIGGLVGQRKPGTAETWLMVNRCRRRLEYHHNYALYSWERFGEYPEACPFENGERKKPGNYKVNWMPCFTSPETVRIIAEAAIEYFDAHPDKESYSVGFPDGAAMCVCEGCRQAGGDLSERAYRLYNRVAEEVAKKHPRKFLGCLAYTQTASPPPFRLHPMIIPMLAYMPNPLFPDGVAEFTGDEINVRESSGSGMAYFKPGVRKGVVHEWLRKADRLGFYDYCYGMGSYAPRILTRARAAALRLGNERGMAAYTGEHYPNWALDGPKLYALARLLWNVREDEDALRADFCRGMYGPAAEPMDRYFKRCEEQLYKYPAAAANWDALPAFDGEVVGEALNDLSEAAKLAGEDKLIRRRIEFCRKAFEVTRLAHGNFEPLRALRRGEPIGKVLKGLAEFPDIMGAVTNYFESAYTWKALTDYKPYEVGGELANATYAWHPAGFQPRKWDSPFGASLHFGRPEAEVMGKVVALVQSKALDLAKGAAPEQFMPLMREEVRRQLAEGFAGVEVVAGTKLAQLREEAEFGATLFLTAEKVKTGPVLREGLDDAFWVKASREGGFKEYKTHGAVTTRTEFAACHDGKDLYIGVWCHQPRAETEAKTAKLGNENRNGVELFINRTVPGSVKWQLLFNAAGGVKGYSDETAAICPWVCPDLTSAVRVGDDAWTLVARIPFASLGIDPAVDKTIGLQVVRNKSVPENDGKLEISTWYPSSIIGHRWAGRGLLVLE